MAEHKMPHEAAPARDAPNAEVAQAHPAESHDMPFPQVNAIGFDAPLRWLARGVADVRAHPLPSLFYGACFAAMGTLLLVVYRYAYPYLMGLTSGFLLLGPFLALGLYELSRRREQGESVTLSPTLIAWRRNAGSIGVYAVALIIVFLVWARASLVMFALFHTSGMPSVEGFLQQVVSLKNAEFLIAYFMVGLLFASIVFAVSVISIPLMLDRGQDAITSMLVSCIALFRNFPQIALWAALIVLITALGFASFFVGLIVLMPVVGHATWHAYRDLVEPMAAPALAARPVGSVTMETNPGSE